MGPRGAGAPAGDGLAFDVDAGLLFVIRTRWLVIGTLAIVIAIGALVYADETARSEAALDDLGDRQAEIARAAVRDDLAAIEQPGRTIVLAGHESIRTLDGRHAAPPELVAAIANGDRVARIAPAVAAELGLPERTAMIGIARGADGRVVAVVTSAEHQRDRDFGGRKRVLLATLLAVGVVAGVRPRSCGASSAPRPSSHAGLPSRRRREVAMPRSIG